MDEIEKRFQSNIYGEFPTNCIGNLVYLSNKSEKEHFFNPNNFYDKYFNMLRQTQNPKRGDIILWEELVGDKKYHSWQYKIIDGEKRNLLHGAIVGNSELTEIYHRPGSYLEIFDENAKAVKNNLENINNWILNIKEFQGKNIITNFYNWKQ
jgi:hypothetical protein